MPETADTFKKLFEKSCNIVDNGINEIRNIEHFDCNSIHNFDNEYNKFKKNYKSQGNVSHSGELVRDFSQEIDTIISEARELNAGPSQMNLIDGMEIGAEEDVLNMIDPLSKVQIRNPVKNAKCSHIYEKESIESAIRANSKVRCAYLGCGNRAPVKLTDLIVDDQLKNRINQALTQQLENTILNEDSD